MVVKLRGWNLLRVKENFYPNPFHLGWSKNINGSVRVRGSCNRFLGKCFFLSVFLNLWNWKCRLWDSLVCPWMVFNVWTKTRCLGVCPCGVSEVWVGLGTLFLRNLENKPHDFSAFTILQRQNTGPTVSQRGRASEIHRAGRTPFSMEGPTLALNTAW